MIKNATNTSNGSGVAVQYRGAATKFFVVFVCLLLLGFGLFFVYKHQTTQYNQLHNSQKALQEVLKDDNLNQSEAVLNQAKDIAKLRNAVDDEVARQLQTQYDEILARLTSLSGSSNQATADMANKLFIALSNKAGTGIGVSGENNTTISNKGVVSVNNQTGDVTIQGTSNQTNVSQQGNVTVIGAAQDIAPNSSPTFNNQNLSGNLSVQGGATVQGTTTTGSLNIQNSGTQNGYALCDASNNCGYSGAGSSFVQGGNSFGNPAYLGTNDSNSLNLETNGTTRFTIDATGNANFTGNVTTPGSIGAGSFSGDGSNVTNVDASQLSGQNGSYYQDASNVNAGTLQDGRLSTNVTLQGNSFNGVNQLVKLTSGGILPVLDGSQLTNVVASNALQLGGQGMSYFLNASNLNAGMLSDALLSGNVTLQGNSFNGVNQLVKLNTGGLLPVLDGSQLTNIDAKTLNGQLAAYYLNASNFDSGTLADARLSANVVLKNATNTFTGTNNFAGLTATGILQNGYSVCDVSNNCSYASSIGGAGYIQNQTAVAQSAGFNISGNGYIGGSIGLGTTLATKKLTIRTDTSSDGISLLGSGDKVISMQRFGNQEVQLQATSSDLFKIRAPSGFGDIATFNMVTGATIFGGSVLVQGGISSPGGVNSEQFGLNSVASGYFSTAIGYGAQSSGRSIAIGYSAHTDPGDGYAVAIGHGAWASGIYSVALGTASSAQSYSIALGHSSTAMSNNSVAIGKSSNAVFSNSIALGRSASTTAINQLVVGSDAYGINNGYFGNGVTAVSPQGFTLNATGGQGTDIQGANLTLAGGRGTGSASGGDILFSTTDVGASGSSANALTERMRISSNGNIGINTSNPQAMLDLGARNPNDSAYILLRSGVSSSPRAAVKFFQGASDLGFVGYAGSTFTVDSANNNLVVSTRTNASEVELRLCANCGSSAWRRLVLGSSGLSYKRDSSIIISNQNETQAYFTQDTTIGASTKLGQLGVVNDVASDVGLVVQGVSGQTANLQEWRNSAGTVLAKIAANGNLTVKSAEVQGDLTVTGNANFAGDYITFSNNVRGYNVTVSASSSSQVVAFGAPHAGYCQHSVCNSLRWVVRI